MELNLFIDCTYKNIMLLLLLLFVIWINTKYRHKQASYYIQIIYMINTL